MSAWGNLQQLSPFDVLQTYQPEYSASNGVNVETLPGGAIELGSPGFTTDGRRFRLCVLPTTGTTLAACKLIQGPAQTSSFHLGTVSAQSAGDQSITFTFAGGAATVAANLLSGGFLSIVTGTGSPQQVQISGNGAVTSSTTIVLQLQDPLVLATAANATAEVYQNQYSAPIVMPGTTLSAAPVGVNPVSVTVSTTIPTYFWAQDQGIATCLGQGTTGIGLGAAPGTAPGSLAVVAATTPQLAVAMEAGADGLYSLWDLQIG